MTLSADESIQFLFFAGQQTPLHPLCTIPSRTPSPIHSPSTRKSAINLPKIYPPSNADTLHDTRGEDDDEVLMVSKVWVEAIAFAMKVCMVNSGATGVAGGLGREHSIR